MTALAVKLLWHSWRSGALQLVAGALVLAVAVVTSVALLADRVQLALTEQSATFLAADLVVRVVAMLGQSTPGFVVGLLLIFALSVGFGVLPPMGRFVPLTEDPLANLSQMILPAITLGTAFAAAVIRIARSAMLDILREDFVRTARSQGLSSRRVIWRHALPNALIPVVTLSGVEFGYLLGGAVLVEQIFALPGLGQVVLHAIQQRDYALVQGSVLFIAFNFMVVNLLVDLAYAALDPRIRLDGK